MSAWDGWRINTDASRSSEVAGGYPMSSKIEDERYEREREKESREVRQANDLERIADSVDRLVIAVEALTATLNKGFSDV
jgi:hypothetical protein